MPQSGDRDKNRAREASPQVPETGGCPGGSLTTWQDLSQINNNNNNKKQHHGTGMWQAPEHVVKRGLGLSAATNDTRGLLGFSPSQQRRGQKLVPTPCPPLTKPLPMMR